MSGIFLNGGGWQATVEPALGGNLTRLCHNGQAVYMPLNGPQALQNNPFVHGSPILLPANRTANAGFCFAGRQFSLPVTEASTGANLHGCLYNAPFAVRAAAPNKAVLFYRNCGAVYPFPFTLTVTYRIKDGAFWQEYALKNTGATAMPYTFGLHTSFCAPQRFKVPLARAEERTKNYLPTGRLLPLSALEQQFVCGAVPEGQSISGYYTAAGRTAVVGHFQYKVFGPFSHWVLFNAGGQQGLLCIEPLCGSVNGLNRPHCPVLKPHQTVCFKTRLRVQSAPLQG